MANRYNIASGYSQRRRQAVASLLLFANELVKAGRISKVSKCFLKELIVHENEQIMSIGDDLVNADGRACVAMDFLDDIIKYRASKSHQELFEACPLEEAHFLSQRDIEKLVKMGFDTKSLVYGEVDFWSFYDVIKVAVAGMDISEGKGLKFYDLGSGSGKALFAAVLAADFRCAVGIEVLSGVHRASKRVLKRYSRLVEPVLSSPALIELHHGSFLAPEFDWTDGDVVFANSTCFVEDILSAIAERASHLRHGARILTFTKALKTPWLRVLLKKRCQMTWGPVTVFVHQKLRLKQPVGFERQIPACGFRKAQVVLNMIFGRLRIAERTSAFDKDEGICQPSGGTKYE